MSGENRKYTVIKQPVPEWFDGTIYQEGDIVKNRFSGEEIELNNIELSIYDLVMGCSLILEMKSGPFSQEKIVKDLRKGLSWFMKYSPKAYMVLLD